MQSRADLAQQEEGLYRHSPLRQTWIFAVSDGTPLKSVIVAAVVGTILTAINQGDLIFAGKQPVWWKMGLTYVVPYCVSTYGATTAKWSALHRARRLAAVHQVALQLIEDQSVRDAAVFDMQLLDNAGGSGGSGGNGGGNTNGGSGGASTNGGGSRKQRKGNSGGGSPGQAYCNNCEAGAAAGDGGRGCKAAALLQQPQLLQPQ